MPQTTYLHAYVVCVILFQVLLRLRIAVSTICELHNRDYFMSRIIAENKLDAQTISY